MTITRQRKLAHNVPTNHMEGSVAPATPLSVDTPAIDPEGWVDPSISGLAARGNGGYQYAGGDNPHPIFTGWPLRYSPIQDDTNQGISLDSMIGYHLEILNDTEGNPALFQNGGANPAPVPLSDASTYAPVPADQDMVIPSYRGSGPQPYQVDTNIHGPVTGRSESMNGNTLQPDYAPQGQYGASTGGGTGMHETVVSYYMAQAVQVQRDYAAAALFASV